MLSQHVFIRDEVYPSYYVNALGKYLSLGAFNFTLTKQDATHVQVTAAADEGAAIIAIAGLWRWIEATINRAHPGGAAGNYDVYVTGKAQDVRSVPATYSDFTDYSFALAIVASGATPTIVAGVVDEFRLVGSLVWDGAQITRVAQSVGLAPPHAHTHATGQSDPLAPVDIGAATEADLLAEVSNRATSEAAIIAAIVAEAAARTAADALLVVHVAAWKSTESPTDVAGTIIAEVPASFLAGQGLSVVGVRIKCSTVQTTPTKFTIQTDHGSGGGVLSDVLGLVNATPAQGRFVDVLANPGGGAAPFVLADTDSIAFKLATPGDSLGCKVSLLLKRTA